jgi:hypothetical protein
LDPNLNEIYKSPGLCERECENSDWIMKWFMLSHVFGFIVTLFREIYETKIKIVGFLMRMLEVMVIGVWYNVIFYAMFEITTYWLLGSNFEEIIKILDGASNMLGGRMSDFDK